jgi:TfoX/Sxy family transcriptional regulator of competence genes
MANKMAESETKGNAIATPATNPAMGMFGDMSMLRDIIMGPKVIEDNSRFEIMDNVMAENKEALTLKMDKLEQDMNARFDSLEQLLRQNIEQMNTKMAQTSRHDKDTFADLLIHLAEGLKKA